MLLDVAPRLRHRLLALHRATEDALLSTDYLVAALAPAGCGGLRWTKGKGIGVKYVNLTPHTVDLRHGDVALSLPSEGVARVSETAEPAGTTPEGLPLTDVRLGDVEGLPEPTEGVAYLVSIVTAAAVARVQPDRTDVYYPYPLLRDDAGRVVGAGGLARYR